MSTKGIKLSPETRAKMSAVRTGKRHTEESKKKLSESRKALGIKLSDEHRRKLMEGRDRAIREGRYDCELGCTCGKHARSEEYRSKMSVASKKAVERGRKSPGPPSEEHRRKNSEAHKGNKNNTSEKMREKWARGVYDKNHKVFGTRGFHAGINMDCLNSEGVFARDLDAAGIEWHYHPQRFKLSWCTYAPDFYLPEFNVWVEVKGYPRQPGNWREKIDTFRRETGKSLVLVFQSELSSLTYEVGD